MNPIPQKERPLDKELLRPWLSRPLVAKSFREYFPATPTHFNKLHYMVMRNLLIRTDCGPTDAEVRELLAFMAELGIVEFKDDLVCKAPELVTSS